MTIILIDGFTVHHHYQESYGHAREKGPGDRGLVHWAGISDCHRQTATLRKYLLSRSGEWSHSFVVDHQEIYDLKLSDFRKKILRFGYVLGSDSLRTERNRLPVEKYVDPVRLEFDLLSDPIAHYEFWSILVWPKKLKMRISTFLGTPERLTVLTRLQYASISLYKIYALYRIRYDVCSAVLKLIRDFYNTKHRVSNKYKEWRISAILDFMKVSVGWEQV